MSVHKISATEALQHLAAFDAVIDARSEAEFAEDHLPGAVNWPTLNNEERRVIGTLYKQVNPFEAKKRGAAISARNIAAHIERELLDTPKSWQPLVYCWRGGNRSGALATILGAIGFKVTLVEGGYKAYRTAVLADLPAMAQRLRYRVVCGRTGTGKTHLLQALAAQGAQILDLEALAQHRSSVLGLIPGQPQPSQKLFDSRLWAALRALDPAREVYVEAESKRVGNVTVPEALIHAMRASPCLTLEMDLPDRVALLLHDYAFFAQDAEFFCDRLATLTELRGRETVGRWQAQARSGQMAEVVEDLLANHYDPRYEESMARNFVAYPTSTRWPVTYQGAGSFEVLARQLLAASN
ncbi:tRNA 2-selenouridine(34) synthase MnmH [Hydrogenophaga defluvii]|uniref:tRNA 2-selenouridine(34) synthase MnmH n=1 Tax=Hydrogenophaga defluvii TaxID=249410 RepID=A0ABW2SBK0_9BURK